MDAFFGIPLIFLIVAGSTFALGVAARYAARHYWDTVALNQAVKRDDTVASNRAKGWDTVATILALTFLVAGLGFAVSLAVTLPLIFLVGVIGTISMFPIMYGALVLFS